MKQTESLLLLAAIGGGLYLYSTSPARKRSWLINWANSQADGTIAVAAFKAMTDAEIVDTYDYIKNYIGAGKTVPAGTPLFLAIAAISTKYNIFT